jgi:hypothetical protein
MSTKHRTTPPASTGPAPERGLLITTDAALARAFRRELQQCDDCPAAFEVHSSFEDARAAGDYTCVTIDLDGAISPAEAVRLSRTAWPTARVAVLSYWWSERDSDARGLADLVIHKPLRQPELRAFLRYPAGAPSLEAVEPPDLGKRLRRAG